MGYHSKYIEKGELGELSKVLEEVHEAIDGHEQGNQLMVLIELSDVIGAYLEKHHPSLTIGDLHEMALATKRAFQDGERQ